MITKQDCLILLSEIGATDKIKELLAQPTPSVEIIKFINDSRQLDLTRFYEKLRKSYNQKHSKLYINIVKETEDVNDVLTTLSALLTQILLFSKNTDDKIMFLRHARADEISLVLNSYFKTYDITNCLKLMRIIKADLKVCEAWTKK